MRVLTRDRVEAALAKGGTARVDTSAVARFKPGDAVVARNLHPPGHTRVPRYVRGRTGRVTADHGVFIFADDHAMGKGPNPQHVYSVAFAASELWGDEASPRHAVHVDLWDDHLDPA